jgi:poly(A) polymerase
MLKLLQTVDALASIEQLKAVGLATGIYPLLDTVVERADDPFVKLALQDTDRRVGEGKPVAPSFLLACVLWADVRKGWERRLKPRGNQRPPPPFAALQDAVDEAFDNRIGDVSGRGKLGSDMREIWMMQPRFEKRAGTSPFSLVNQGRFRAGFDFLRLRGQVGEIDEELAHWWETFQNVSDDMRQDMVDEQRKSSQSKPGAGKARRVKRTDADHPAQNDQPVDPRFRHDDPVEGGVSETEADAPEQVAEGHDGIAAPKKRRRRRRKPSGGGGDASPAPDGGAGD